MSGVTYSAEMCFYCRRGQHWSCISGETPCPCEPHEEED